MICPKKVFYLCMRVDKNIPIPEQIGGGRRIVHPFHKLEVGDSFFVKTKNKGYSIYSCLRVHNNKLPRSKRIKITQKQEKKGIRVWRIK